MITENLLNMEVTVFSPPIHPLKEGSVRSTVPRYLNIQLWHSHWPEHCLTFEIREDQIRTILVSLADGVLSHSKANTALIPWTCWRQECCNVTYEWYFPSLAKLSSESIPGSLCLVAIREASQNTCVCTLSLMEKLLKIYSSNIKISL